MSTLCLSVTTEGVLIPFHSSTSYKQWVLTRRPNPADAPDVDVESIVVVKGADIPAVKAIFIDDCAVWVARVDGPGVASLVALGAARVGDVDIPVAEIDSGRHC